MIITISGLSGSGKSTVAKILSERIGIPTVDIGTIFRAMAKQHNMDVAEFGRYAEAHPEIDRELDAVMMRRAKRKKNLILQGRLAGWMTKNSGITATRIWMAAKLITRAKRVIKREEISYRQALKEVDRRDKDNLIRYMQTYGLDLNDLSIYDIVVQTDNLTVEQVVSSLVNKLSKIWQTKKKIPLQKRKKQVKLKPKKKQPAKKKLPQTKR